MERSLVTQQDVEAFERDGFVRGGRFLEDVKADRLFSFIQRVVESEDHELHGRVHDFGHGGRPLLHIRNLWKEREEFRALHRHPMIREALSQLTGHSRFQLWHDRFFYKPRNSGSFHTWHQDYSFLPFLAPFRAMSVWVALTDADQKNGAMSMVPGSHKWGDASIFLEQHADLAGENSRLPATYGEHVVRVVERPVPRGYVHFHDCKTWHSSGPNWSDDVRCAIAMFVVDADVRFDGGSQWAKDYAGSHGEPLDPMHYPFVGEGQAVPA